MKNKKVDYSEWQKKSSHLFDKFSADNVHEYCADFDIRDHDY